MVLERRVIDVSSMFGIVQPDSDQAKINLERQRKIAQDLTIKERPLWDNSQKKKPRGVFTPRGVRR